MVTLLAPKMFEHNSDNGSADGATQKSPQESPQEVPRLSPLPAATTRDLVLLFKLLGDDTRVRVLHYLMQREELNVRTLCKLLSQSQPAVSHHLALLREDGIIACRRERQAQLLPHRPQADTGLPGPALWHQQRRNEESAD